MGSHIYVIGHRPPPVTGENLCLRQLEATLCDLGQIVISRSRSDWRNIFLIRSRIWLIAGGKRLGHPRDFLWLLWWRLLGCQVSIYIHNISWRHFLKRAWLWRLLGRGHFRYVVLTDEIKDALGSAGFSVTRLNNTLTDGDEPAACEPRVPVRRLLWMSAVTLEKGFPLAYETFLKLRDKDPEWCMDVYGAGPLSGDGTRFPHARFHGFTHGSEKQAALDAGGIFILPSRYVNETQPLSIIEALANGVPFVASTIGGIPTMRGRAMTKPAGVCIDVYVSVEEWVSAIESVYENYASYSHAAKEVYRQDFSRAAYRDGVRRLVLEHDWPKVRRR